jgi:hypothetical protein
MLTGLDETLLHQASVTFDQTEISDHRFFDRTWFGGFAGNDLRFMCGIAAYKNANTIDGYFVVSRAGKQHNLRLSRPMLPEPARMAVGPLSVAIVEPLKEMKITLAPGSTYEFSAELRFRGDIVPHLEMPHIKRVDGRLVQNYSRFDQVGRFDGWIELQGQRFLVEDWFGARDHSWGTRPGVGGYEPVTSDSNAGGNPDDVGDSAEGFLLISLMFDSPDCSGFLQVKEDGSGKRSYTDGACFRKTEPGPALSVRHIEHDLTFVDGTRTCSHGSLRVTLSDGTTLSIEAETLLPMWCFKGTGYDFGYGDERGLGLFRGHLIEADIYDVSHPEEVVLPNGRKIRPWHREGDSLIRVNNQDGFAHFAVISSGRVAKYCLHTPITNRSP